MSSSRKGFRFTRTKTERVVVIIANPGAREGFRRDTQARLRQACEILRQEGEAKLWWTREPGEATQLARQGVERGANLVVAAGGDGTIHEVVNGLAGTSTALGLLPMGTENVLARYAGLSRNLEICCQKMLRQKPRRVDLGKIGDRYFLLFAGIGFDAHVVRKTQARLKRKLGGIAFAWTALVEAWKHRNDAPTFRIQNGDNRIAEAGWILLAGNIPVYGWQLSVLPGAQMADGKLDACLFPRASFWQNLRQVGLLLQRKDPSGVRRFQFERIRVETNPVMEVQADGELCGSTPCEISVVPEALWVRF